MYTSNKTTSKFRTLMCAVMLLSMAPSTTQAIFGLWSRTHTQSPTPSSNQNLHGSCDLQAERAQKLMSGKQLAVNGITQATVSNVSTAIDNCAYRINRLDITRSQQEFNLAAKKQLEKLNFQLMFLASEHECDTVSAFVPLSLGCELSLIAQKNNEILTYLEANRAIQHGFLYRMLVNKYILVGLPVVATTLGFLYRDDLKGMVPALREGITSLRNGSINAGEVAKQVGTAIKEVPNLHATKQLVDAAKGAYAVAINETQRKNIALGVLSVVCAGLLYDTYGDASLVERTRALGTYSPLNLFSSLNNNMRFSSDGGYWKSILGIPLSFISAQTFFGFFASTENNGWNVEHLPAIAGMRDNWMYKALEIAQVRIAEHKDRVGFKMMLPFFAGSPAKMAVFTILTAGLASRSIREIEKNYNNEQLGVVYQMYNGIIAGSEIVGAVTLAALLTNVLMAKPPASA